MIELIARKRPPPGLRPALRRALGAVLREQGVAQAVTVVLVGDRTIRALKREHWGEDAASDVLSFPAWQPGDPFVPPHLGDIVISLDTAAAQAHERGHSLTEEVALLASHGLTHLLGFDHPHADGLGYEEGAVGPEWEPFHRAWATARSALTER